MLYAQIYAPSGGKSCVTCHLEYEAFCIRGREGGCWPPTSPSLPQPRRTDTTGPTSSPIQMMGRRQALPNMLTERNGGRVQQGRPVEAGTGPEAHLGHTGTGSLHQSERRSASGG